MGYSMLTKLAPVRAWVIGNITKRHSSEGSSEGDGPRRLTSVHKVDNLEKRFLVWTGKYKTLDEVPAFVSQGVMERARNRMRIKIANYMMLATVLGCIAMVYMGKQDAKAGKTVQQMNLDWHKQIKEDHEKELAKPKE